MNLLFVRSTSGFSGAEIYTIRVCESLTKLGEHCVVATNHQPFIDALKSAGIKAIWVDFLPNEIGTKKTLLTGILHWTRQIRIWKEMTNSIKPNIDIYILESMTEKILITPLLRLHSKRVIWIEHGPIFRTNRSKLVLWLYKKISTMANHIITVSTDTKDDLVQGGIDKELLTAIHIGITKPVKRIHRADTQTKTVGFLGTICTEKGIEDYLDIMEQSMKINKQMRGIIIGTGPKASWCKGELVKRTLDKKIDMIGFVSDPAKYIQQMNYLLFPTHHEEGLSLTLLECMSQGVIPIVRDKGGNRELVIHGKTGCLFQTNREAVDWILQGIKDEKKYAVMQKNIQKLIEREFDEVKQANKIIVRMK